MGLAKSHRPVVVREEGESHGWVGDGCLTDVALVVHYLTVVALADRCLDSDGLADSEVMVDT